MRNIIRPALAAVAIFTASLGVVLPVGFTLLSGALLPHQAGGSLVSAQGKIFGSELIGQDFTSDRYFHPRPSATTEPDPGKPGGASDHPYNGAASGASNLGPTSASLLATVQARVAALGAGPVPADAATASASGLDPHISPAYAQRQVARVAEARHLPPEHVARLVGEQVLGRELGVLGESRVNVLQLNLALDTLW